ncbi:MAG: type II secretion system ATPase GspE [Candidatus Omnitrophota bacterium]|nr:MAG: type II secretion system ATPase GspE [Candidatus Omnitrophota bacterium]
MEKKEVIDLLLERGLVNIEAIEAAKEEVKRTGLSIEKALEKLGYLSQEDIANAQADALGIPYMDLKNYNVDVELMESIPRNLAKKYRAIPLLRVGENLTVAMADPRDIMAIDQLRRSMKVNAIVPVLATEESIQKVLDEYYGIAGSLEDIVKTVDKDRFAEVEEMDLAEAAEETPIIKLVNYVILQAVKDKASDIHIEPELELTRVRYRIDGILHEVNSIPKKLHRAVVSRIKILSQLDIAESRVPQDGKVRMRVGGTDLDVRVSTFPTINGENVVMRLLIKSAVLLGLEELGFSNQYLEGFNKLIRKPNGIMLVTGPTGSGKTTTLYAALSTINSIEKNIITVEDPVEYELPLIRQTQVNPKAGVTFATGLRSILRQDPDVIMVGEIRDLETAEVAIQAALTGHLVFSTLHTNDAPSALTRLVDMGLEPFLISSSVIGILAQRLVRLICNNCKEKYAPPKAVLKDLGLESNIDFYRGKGCDECKGTGYSGRTGIYELLILDEELRNLIDAKKSADEIKKKCRAKGMKVLREVGLGKMKQGLTSPEEVLRVTMEAD